MAISREEVMHIAKLARLQLSEDEIKRFQIELGKIIEYFDQLKKLDTENVPPMTHAVPLENVLREDQVKESLPAEEALQNTPEKKNSYFQVPKVVGRDS
jgi:aspartyl-tRNA(Asn)/glutamyl-tRNA(Gln) amidotransferase subunit C